MQLTSRDNPLVREMRLLLAEPKARRESGRFVIEGARLCEDAARSGVRIAAVLYTQRAAEQYPELLAAVRTASARQFEIAPPLSQFLGDTQSPQGVFCLCEALDNVQMLDTIETDCALSTEQSYLALEDLQDPGNLGTIIRTAEAMGLGGLILSAGCCDLYNPKVLRGSMGGVFRLPAYITADMPATAVRLREQGFCMAACVPDGDAEPLQTAVLGPGSICLIGNEGNGLRPETIEACGSRLTIPMAGRAESLNASMAAGIILWEMARRRL